MIIEKTDLWKAIYRINKQFAKWLSIPEHSETTEDMIKACNELKFNIHKAKSDLIGKYIKVKTKFEGFDEIGEYMLYIKEVDIDPTVSKLKPGRNPKVIFKGMIMTKSNRIWSNISFNDELNINDLLTANKVTIHDSLIEFDRKFIELIGKSYFNKLKQL